MLEVLYGLYVVRVTTLITIIVELDRCTIYESPKYINFNFIFNNSLAFVKLTC